MEGGDDMLEAPRGSWRWGTAGDSRPMSGARVDVRVVRSER